MSHVTIVIVGAGGLGREVYCYLNDLIEIKNVEWKIKGFLDDKVSSLKEYGIDSPVFSTVSLFKPEPSDRVIVAVGDPVIRKKIVDSLVGRNVQFVSVVHPLAYVAKGAKIGPGCLIAPFAFVGPNSDIGSHTVLNAYASVGHDSNVGSFSVFSPYAAITGNVEVGTQVFFGTHTTVVPGRKIGELSKVAAGAVVMRDVPPFSLAVGSPAKCHEVYKS